MSESDGAVTETDGGVDVVLQVGGNVQQNGNGNGNGNR